MNFMKFMWYIAHLILYTLGITLIYQLIKIIIGGSWSVEEAVIALLVLNITLTITIGGYTFHSHISLLHNISQVDKKITAHLAWHKGKDE